MASTRAKFRCHSKVQDSGGGAVIRLHPVYSADPTTENYEFWNATPNGSIDLWVTNPNGAAVFEQNKEYYVDFTPVESA